MGAVNTTYTFQASDTITSTKMNNIIDQTTITDDAIFGTTLEVADGKLKIRSQGITSNELTANAVKTIAIEDGAVTSAKLNSSVILVPTSAVMAFAGGGPPSGWLYCDGQAVSRTTYAALFAIISITYGAGNGSTTFNVPDLRGAFIRGHDNGRGLDPSRGFGSYQEDALQNITGTAGRFQSSFAGTTNSGAFTLSSSSAQVGGGGSGAYQTVDFNASLVARTSTETRPKNYALHYFIKI